MGHYLLTLRKATSYFNVITEVKGSIPTTSEIEELLAKYKATITFMTPVRSDVDLTRGGDNND